MDNDLSDKTVQELDAKPWPVCRIMLPGVEQVIRTWMFEQVLDQVHSPEDAKKFMQKWGLEYKVSADEHDWGVSYQTVCDNGLYIPFPKICFPLPKHISVIPAELILQGTFRTDRQCNLRSIHDTGLTGMVFSDTVAAARIKKEQLSHEDELQQLAQEAISFTHSNSYRENSKKGKRRPDPNSHELLPPDEEQYYGVLCDKEFISGSARTNRIGWYESVWVTIVKGTLQLDKSSPVLQLARYYSSILGEQPAFVRELLY